MADIEASVPIYLPGNRIVLGEVTLKEDNTFTITYNDSLWGDVIREDATASINLIGFTVGYIRMAATG